MLCVRNFSIAETLTNHEVRQDAAGFFGVLGEKFKDGFFSISRNVVSHEFRKGMLPARLQLGMNGRVFHHTRDEVGGLFFRQCSEMGYGDWHSPVFPQRYEDGRER